MIKNPGKDTSSSASAAIAESSSARRSLATFILVGACCISPAWGDLLITASDAGGGVATLTLSGTVDLTSPTNTNGGDFGVRELVIFQDVSSFGDRLAINPTSAGSSTFWTINFPAGGGGTGTDHEYVTSSVSDFSANFDSLTMTSSEGVTVTGIDISTQDTTVANGSHRTEVTVQTPSGSPNPGVVTLGGFISADLDLSLVTPGTYDSGLYDGVGGDGIRLVVGGAVPEASECLLVMTSLSGLMVASRRRKRKA